MQRMGVERQTCELVMLPFYQRPIAMLTDQQLAKLFVHLEVPVALQAILDAPHMFDDEARFSFQDLINAQTPDKALLSITLCALLLDARMREAGHRSAEILAMSAEMMTQDYAPLYIEHVAKHPTGTLFDRTDLDFLATIPEDLENIADLLAVVADVLPVEDALFINLATILAQQAQAQALIAETLVEAFSGEIINHFEPEIIQDEPRMIGGNVVPFRRRIE
jgi:hypothetical protein